MSSEKCRFMNSEQNQPSFSMFLTNYSGYSLSLKPLCNCFGEHTERAVCGHSILLCIPNVPRVVSGGVSWSIRRGECGVCHITVWEALVSQPCSRAWASGWERLTLIGSTLYTSAYIWICWLLFLIFITVVAISSWTKDCLLRFSLFVQNYVCKH